MFTRYCKLALLMIGDKPQRERKTLRKLVCGAIYAPAKNVSKAESAPLNVTGIVGIVCGILFVFAGAKLIDDLFFSLKTQSGSRNKQKTLAESRSRRN